MQEGCHGFPYFPAIMMEVEVKGASKPFISYNDTIRSSASSLQPNKKYFLIQPRYEYTLENFLHHPAVQSIAVKLDIFQQLLSGLDAFHHIDLREELGSPASWKPFMQSIHISNILVRPSGRSWEVTFSRFEKANQKDTIVLVGWDSPETLAFYAKENYKSSLLISQFNQKGGQARDMWALGVVFSHLLRHSAEPLESLRSLNPGQEPSIQQAAIDRDLQTIRSGLIGPDRFIIDQLWNLAADMLRADPAQRIAASKARQRLIDILSKVLYTTLPIS